VRDNTFKDWGSNPGKVRLTEGKAFGSKKKGKVFPSTALGGP
jgi:hypothetical protein